uniref:Peptidase A1 domain-containing protein n=1 Tax=Oryza punctata TaxID=4537 RepID=A0A0E0L965_ORYPU
MRQQLVTLLVLIALPARAASAPGAGGVVYLVHLSVGTPPRPVALTLDTGSDLVWTQCAPCLDCFEQGVPVLDPAASSTYAALPCDAPLCRALPFTSCGGRSWGDRSCVYVYHYGDRSLTVGQLATDSFTFGSSSGTDNAGGLAERRLTFGCGHFNKGIFQANETGIAGFGRGRWSLPSQLNVTSFSYCFTSMFDSKSSVVTLGAPAELYSHAHTGDVRTTRFIKNPSQPSLYFVPLRGISVGTTRIAVPESRLRSSTIIDSGASITTLPEDVYEAVKAEFVSQLGLPAGGVEGSALDLCFALPVAALWRRPAVPALTLHLDGGADWELPRGNYVFEDYAARVLCVVLDAAAGEQIVIGNYQQQNTHVVYDLENDMLSFAPARCDKLAVSL